MKGEDSVDENPSDFSRRADQRIARDPATSPAQLAAIVQFRPDLWADVALNPDPPFVGVGVV